jgi:hypothetical protein
MDGLPDPSPELVIIGAGLIELDLALKELGLGKPSFTERVLAGSGQRTYGAWWSGYGGQSSPQK